MREARIRERNGGNLSETLKPSKHAMLRMAQRNFSLHDLEYVLEYGIRMNVSGLAVYILRKIDIPHDDRNKSEITRLEGAVVLTELMEDGTTAIITAYRNKSALKEFRSKTKYDGRKKYRTQHNFSIVE